MVQGRHLRNLTYKVLAIAFSGALLSHFVQFGGGQGTEGDGPLVSRAVPVTFSNVSVEVGLSELTGNFFSWGDIDSDGHQDLLMDGKRLMRNTGPPDFRFEDITPQAMLDSHTNSGVFADFDNDGRLDIFCGGGALSSDHPTYPDLLWKNVGGGSFEDVTTEYGGISDTFPTAAGGWADLDKNGFVDLYMVNYENATYQGYPDHLWSNVDGSHFVNISQIVQKNGSIPSYQGRGVSWGDFDNDGWQDAYVSNYRIMRNYLFRNMEGHDLSESAEELGVEGHASMHPVTRDGPYYGHSLGSSWGDLDNDGDLDLWVTNLAHKDPWRGPICDDSYLFENLGPEEGYRFADRREGSGIEIKTIPGSLGGGDELMVSSSLADYDNDGDLDLFIPQIYGDVSYAYSLLYRNDGGLTFTEVGSEAGLRVWNTYGSAWCDYNEDGWVDLVTGGGVWDQSASLASNYMVHLFRNDGASKSLGNQWLEVSLEGSSSNRAAIGARVTAWVDRNGDGGDDLTILREVQGGQGAHGQQDSMTLHFGLGAVQGDIGLEVRWPLGRTSVIKGLTTNTIVQLVEPQDEVSVTLEIAEPTGMAKGISTILELENTCGYTLDGIEVSVSLTGNGGQVRADLALDSVLVPGDSAVLDVPLEGAVWGEGCIIKAEVTRSFPPLTTGGSSELAFRVLDNEPPVAILTGPSRVVAGERFLLSGAGSYDQDGTVSMYLFDPGDGSAKVRTEVPELDHTYVKEGSYLATLDVFDDRGEVSEAPSVHRIMVDWDPSAPPQARIIRITPDQAFKGEEVFFEGRGSTESGATISFYEWTSSIDGPLSSEGSFATRSLSEGNHTIYFRVIDSRGLSSETVTAKVSIIWTDLSPLFVTITYPEDMVVVKGTLKVRGSSGPMEIVDRVEIRIDGGTWMEVSDHSLPYWSVFLDISDLSPGEHLLEARAGHGTELSALVNVTFLVPDGGLGQKDTNGTADVVAAPVLGLTFAALFVIVAIISASVLMTLRKRQKGPAGSGHSEVETAILLDEMVPGERI